MSFQLARLLAQKIQRAATRARGSELKLQGEVDGYLREYLKAFRIDYDPEVNKHLQISDYSATGRPDSLFGHVILDYKAPGILRTPAGLRKAKEQVVDDYLNSACSRSRTFDREEADKWAGILLDGRSVTFVTFNGVDQWANIYERIGPGKIICGNPTVGIEIQFALDALRCGTKPAQIAGCLFQHARSQTFLRRRAWRFEWRRKKVCAASVVRLHTQKCIQLFPRKPRRRWFSPAFVPRRGRIQHKLICEITCLTNAIVYNDIHTGS